MSYFATSNMTAGTCTFRAWVSGVRSDATLNRVIGSRQGYSLVTKSTNLGFQAGDYIDATFETSSGYLPTTSVVEVTVFVTIDQSSIV
jgi:hypothetical protein